MQIELNGARGAAPEQADPPPRRSLTRVQSLVDHTEEEPVEVSWFQKKTAALGLSETELETEKLALRDVFRDLTSCYCTHKTTNGTLQSGSIWSESANGA